MRHLPEVEHAGVVAYQVPDLVQTRLVVHPASQVQDRGISERLVEFVRETGCDSFFLRPGEQVAFLFSPFGHYTHLPVSVQPIYPLRETLRWLPLRLTGSRRLTSALPNFPLRPAGLSSFPL